MILLSNPVLANDEIEVLKKLFQPLVTLDQEHEESKSSFGQSMANLKLVNESQKIIHERLKKNEVWEIEKKFLEVQFGLLEQLGNASQQFLILTGKLTKDGVQLYSSIHKDETLNTILSTISVVGRGEEGKALKHRMSQTTKTYMNNYITQVKLYGLTLEDLNKK